MHQTAQNVYSGLVAQYHLQNAWEKENLPQGPYDVPLTISDAMFAKNGSLAYMDRDHSGLCGDVITVNGVPWPFFHGRAAVLPVPGPDGDALAVDEPDVRQRPDQAPRCRTTSSRPTAG